MDFVPGAPLSQLREELKRRGIEIEPGSLAEQAELCCGRFEWGETAKNGEI